MVDRLKQIRSFFGLSQARFAKAINKTAGFISNVETGSCGLSDSTIDDISRVFGVDKVWLVTGEGEMFPPGSEKDPPDKTKVGERIRKVRKDAALTQEQFASKIGYSMIYVHTVESGKGYPSNEFLSRVSSVFGISYNWLLTGGGEEKSDIKPVDEELIKWLNMHTDVLNELRNRAGLN